MKNIIRIAMIALFLLLPAGSSASADHPIQPDEPYGGTLIASIPGPSGWSNIWGVAYHDIHNILFVGGCPNNEVAYGAYSGGETVSWTVFDTVESICGFGCYEDDLLFAITQHDPMNPGPFYLHTWTLNASGIPQLPADVYELGAPFTGAMGGCEWDGDYLWILDQNFVADDTAIIYKYDVSTHSVISSWSYPELGGVGLACVWENSELNIWISDWYGGYKLMELTDSGSPTGASYDITTSPTDIAYKYDIDFDGPGFFVGNHDGNTVDLYDHTLLSLQSNSWAHIKASFL